MTMLSNWEVTCHMGEGESGLCDASDAADAISTGYTNDQGSFLSGHQYLGNFSVSYLLPQATTDDDGNPVTTGSYTVNTDFSGHLETAPDSSSA
eukprot:CAMPEP_0113690180 /NCGR_PEP_ID=MMETSP0038_2-20120614/17623_1 /TAXON_ID=2898 /ORGANISM="Cryptomonas paramecium" /LENGTH=93 /DNA_ID=CAMNT_0000611427 /DNA_START=63 /DNA_END=344 /DNA_ORIENTATION=- /assembly_acc=CAM_ASM_000170